MAQRATGVAHARIGLLGNPSDGYGGKAIAFTLGEFDARVTITSDERMRIIPGHSDMIDFASLAEASRAFDELGCEGGLRLVRAALRRFTLHWAGLRGLSPGDSGLCFAIRYETTIPRQVGLSGSSAIVIATLRALMEWFDVKIHPAELAELALAAEVEDLGIAAGPMDRVAQSYEGLVVMDLRPPRTARSYAALDLELLPPILLGWDPTGGENSGRAHATLRARVEDRDPAVLEVIERYRDLVDEGVSRLESGDQDGLRALVDENFELRKRVFPVSERDRRMVAIARSRGVSAKQCGSGGAILCVGKDQRALDEAEEALRAEGIETLRPTPVSRSGRRP